jgi:hypothetical protein
MSSGSVDLPVKWLRLCEHSLSTIEEARARILHCNEQLNRCRYVLRQHTKRRAATSLLPVIRQRLHDGRLPMVTSPIIFGHPSRGGTCDACSRVLLKNQLVMDIPWGDHADVHLHANCYIVWNAERHKLET